LLISSTYSVPIGYKVPPFPSLYWPAGSSERLYEVSSLYYTYDIWRFTVLWTIILFCCFHFIAGMWASLVKRDFKNGLIIMFLYIGIAGIEAIVSGTIVGLIITGVYRAGLCSVSTWIPLVWAVVQILWMVFTSYSMMNVFL
ncbi:hypothetical protein LXG23DRAFT_14480, partial [Yarrowia lipolytica]